MSSYELATKEIDKQQEKFIARLAEAVAIPSVSADAVDRDDVFQMVNWTQKQMETLHIKCELIENGTQTMPDGSTIPLPPILFGVLGQDKTKKTLLVYGHLDVRPAHIDDGWNSELFKLTM